MAATAIALQPAHIESRLLRTTHIALIWTEQIAPWAALAVVAAFSVWAWFASRSLPLQFDELLEIAAASAPSSRQVLSFLASGIDFNPPLSHLLVRASMSVFGAGEWAARLPAFIGMLALLASLYAFVSRRLGRSYGLVAILAVLSLPVRQYAVQARPYGLVLGLTGFVLILYPRCVDRSSRYLSLVGLALSSAALCASHYYAVLVVGVLVASELIRAFVNRRVDWALLAASLGPAVAVLWFLRSAIVQQRSVLTHYFARGNLLSFKHGYDELQIDPLVYSVGLLLLIGIITFLVTSTNRVSLRTYDFNFKQALAFPVGLLLLPLIGAVITQLVTHAYVPRYFLPALVGFCVCGCCALEYFSVMVPGLVLLVIFSLGLGFTKSSLQELPHQAEPLPLLNDLAAEDTPLLFDTPGTYLQVKHYFPQLSSRFFVVTDPAASMKFRNYDTDDKIMLALARVGDAQTITLSDAAHKWSHFRLVPRSADYVWALKCVMESGAHIEVKHPFGGGNFIFDVTVADENLRRIDHCVAQ